MQQPPDNEGLPTRIFLLGFMGSGKSTMGPIIANAIGYEFIDLDTEIEQRHSRTIVSLFNELGESGFRAIETSELSRVRQAERTVVSTGGGIVTVADNRRILREAGFSVYLKLSPDALAKRIGKSMGRPLLLGDDDRTLTDEALVLRIEQLISSRSEYYESADLVVDVESESVGEAVETIVRSIRASEKRSI